LAALSLGKLFVLAAFRAAFGASSALQFITSPLVGVAKPKID
jgi:hypothetical protein